MNFMKTPSHGESKVQTIYKVSVWRKINPLSKLNSSFRREERMPCAACPAKGNNVKAMSVFVWGLQIHWREGTYPQIRKLPITRIDCV